MLFEMQWIATSQIGHFEKAWKERFFSISFLSLALFSPLLGLAQEVVLPDANDEETVFQACTLCHGTKEMQRGPILDGLPAWYIEQQLKKFASGQRGKKEENRSALLMVPVVQQYKDPQLWQKLADRFESLEKPNHLKTIRGNPSRGKLLYAICASCHGQKAEGNQTIKAPPLNVLEDWYLMDQLRKFKMDWRGYNPDDVEGNLMRNITKLYSINDLKDIVAYIARIEPESPPTRLIGEKEKTQLPNIKEGETEEPDH